MKELPYLCINKYANEYQIKQFIIMTTISNEEFQKQQRETLEVVLTQINDDIRENLTKAFKSGAIPEDWIANNDFRTIKSVIDSFCVDRPYKVMGDKKGSENLHKFL